MNRQENIYKIKNHTEAFDFAIIGGGATGIGVALEAASRGYSVALFEQSDFTKSTSSKSTKLVHGGVRYMAQGDLALVREACVERGRLVKNAAHLVKNQSFVIPAYGWFDELLYTVGLTFYDLLAGKLSLGRSKRISKSKALAGIPTLKKDKVTAGILYHDGQFDDSRLAVNLLQTAACFGALVVNYCRVTALKHGQDGKLNALEVLDTESNDTFTVKAKFIVNACGVFADEVLQMDKPGNPPSIRPSQGVHIVLDKSFLPGEHALMIPKTDDGRVLFAVPWLGKVVVGTTDTPLHESSLEPKALDEEIEFILRTAGRYLNKAPQRSDVKSVFAGLRPLAAAKGDGSKTKEISRNHKIMFSDSGLVTMIGGKWTTFRRMAQDLVDKSEKHFSLHETHSVSPAMKIHGHTEHKDLNDPMYVYGTDKEKIMQIAVKEPEYNTYIDEELQIHAAQVVWAVRKEMARTIEDVLARRTRCLLLDARQSIIIAPKVAAIMAKELGKDESWQKKQIEDYTHTAQNYIL